MMDQANARQTDGAARENALATMATQHRVAQAQERAVFVAALRVAFGRMSADCPGLDGVVQDVSIKQGALAEVLDLAEPGMFLALLNGPSERMGLLIASAPVLAGLVEAQTTGRVDQKAAPTRMPTRTDAALLAPMIDAFLQLVELRCAELPQAAMVSGYGYGSFLDNPRPLGLMLDDGPFHILHLRVALGFGAKEGDWFLILPDLDHLRQANGMNNGTDADPDKDWQERLHDVIIESGVVLNSVLCRVQLSLTDALRLRTGDTLCLQDSALETLTLESISHTPLGVGRLGQARGQRAVRLTADPGHLSDASGARVPLIALPAPILWGQPAQAPFTPTNSAPPNAELTVTDVQDSAETGGDDP